MNTLPQRNPQRLAGPSHGYEVVLGVVSALAGAGIGLAVGAIPGAIVGLVIGAAMGAAMGWVAGTRSHIDSARNERLDREIGVIDGDIGAPGLKHPPAKIGAFSREVSGAGSASEGERQAEGPMEPPPR